MGSLVQVPDAFRHSYMNFEAYPTNLIYTTTSTSALKEYATQLDVNEALFLARGVNYVKVPFREFTGDRGDVCHKQNILDDKALKELLGDLSTIDPATNLPTGSLITKVDPKVRFISLSQVNSLSPPVLITREMFVRILSYHQVMPSYVEFVALFGPRNNPRIRDLGLIGFRSQVLLGDNPSWPKIPGIRRSGQQYQMCYALKSINPDSRGALTDLWEQHQMAVHHQFDVVEGTTLWIMTASNLAIKDRIQDLTSANGRPEDRAFQSLTECFKSSLAVHSVCIQWATENWYRYIRWMEEEEEKSHQLAELAPRLTSRPPSFNLESLRWLEEKAREAIVTLESNTEVLTALLKFYRDLMESHHFQLREFSGEDVSAFTTNLVSTITECGTHISSINRLLRVIANKKNEIQEIHQSEAAALTRSMHALTRSTLELGVLSRQDAVAMRIITVVTLIYLPATFVSTFFSTDIVKYQNQNGGSSFSNVALYRWLQVTLPLTLITLSVAYFWYRTERRSQELNERRQLAQLDS